MVLCARARSVYVLWPSLMDRVPAWLRKGYDQQDDMRDVLECHWSLHIVARMLLLISEKREDFSKQVGRGCAQHRSCMPVHIHGN